MTEPHPFLISPDSPLVKNLFRKKQLLEAGDPAHKEIRPLLIVMGGGMRGVSGGGAVTALNVLGLNDVFDAVVGASAGAPIAAYFLAGTEQSYTGTTIFYDELSGRKFINPYTFWHMEKLDRLAAAFSQGPKRLDTGAVVRHRSKFFVSLTEHATGVPELFDVDAHADALVQLLVTTSAIPYLYPHPLHVAKRRYLDGNINFSARDALAMQVIKDFRPTDIVLIPNMEAGRISAYERGSNGAPTRFLPAYLSKLGQVRRSVAEDVQALGNMHGVTFGVLTLPEGHADVHWLTTDADRLWKLGNAALKDTLERFGQPDLFTSLPPPM